MYVASAEASGGYKACWLGSRSDNTIEWNDVYVQKKGTRRMTITFFCAEDRSMDLTVNGKTVATLQTHSRDWNRPATIAFDVELKKGCNTIELSNDEGWMPDIDKMTIEP